MKLLLTEVRNNIDVLLKNLKITPNASYNDILFTYWKTFDKFGEIFLKPNEITSYTRIDRIIRDIPGRDKNISEEERFRKYYSAEKVLLLK